MSAANKPIRRIISTGRSASLFAGVLLLGWAIAAPTSAAIITSGDVSPGPAGSQPDPWSPGLLAIGISSNGSLTVNNGSVVNTTTSYIALNSGSSASLLLSGPGTTWNNITALTLGDSGVATAVIEDGALVDIGGTVVMGDSTAGTTVLIGSTNSSNPAIVRIAADLYLGGDSAGPAGGTATVTVATGGLLKTIGQTFIYTGSSIDPGINSFESGGVQLKGGALTGTAPLSVLNLEKSGTVSGSGTVNTNTYLGSGGLIAGDPGETLVVDGTLAGSGTLQGVVFGGSLGIGDPLTNLLGNPLTIDRVVGSIVFHDVTVSPNTVFDFGIHGNTLNDFDQLVLTGTDTLDGIAQIAFVQAFVPAVTDTFQLVDIQSGSNPSGWFSEVYTSPYWHLDHTGLLYHQTPEPQSIFLVLIGLVLLSCQRTLLSVRSRRADSRA